MTPRKPGDPLTLSYIPSATVKPIIKVKESESLSRARTLMMLHNFSQLPVVRGNGDHPIGVVTWEKIGRTLSTTPNATLRDCIDFNPPKFFLNDNLLNAIDTINECGYTLVKKNDGVLSGIVTSADLGATLALIARPILLLERLEDRLRCILEELYRRGVLHDSEIEKSTNGLNDKTEVIVDNLTLGEKIKLATHPDKWQYVTSLFDQRAVAASLEGASSLRNRLMHFRELDTPQRNSLSSLPHLVETIVQIAASMPNPDAEDSSLDLAGSPVSN